MRISIAMMIRLADNDAYRDDSLFGDIVGLFVELMDTVVFRATI